MHLTNYKFILWPGKEYIVLACKNLEMKEGVLSFHHDSRCECISAAFPTGSKPTGA